MNCKNEKHFSRRLNIQVCELYKYWQKPTLKGTLKNKCFWDSSTIINSLKSKILEKYIWRISFLVNLQACRLIASNLTNRWTLSQVFFNSVLSSPCSPHILTQAPPPPLPSNFEEPPTHVLNTSGKPCGFFRKC